MVAKIYLKISANRIFWQFYVITMDFSKKLKFSFLVNLHHFVEHYEARKYEELIWSEKRDIAA